VFENFPSHNIHVQEKERIGRKKLEENSSKVYANIAFGLLSFIFSSFI